LYKTSKLTEQLRNPEIRPYERMSKTQLTQPTPKTVGKQADARICSITCLTRSAAFEGAGRLAPYLVQFNSK